MKGEKKNNNNEIFTFTFKYLMITVRFNNYFDYIVFLS